MFIKDRVCLPHWKYCFAHEEETSACDMSFYVSNKLCTYCAEFVIIAIKKEGLWLKVQQQWLKAVDSPFPGQKSTLCICRSYL